jgi:hypothetical protein
LFLAGKPNESIVGPADGEKGLEDIAVEIPLDILLGVLVKND